MALVQYCDVIVFIFVKKIQMNNEYLPKILKM